MDDLLDDLLYWHAEANRDCPSMMADGRSAREVSDAAEQAVRDSLARIRLVIGTADALDELIEDRAFAMESVADAVLYIRLSLGYLTPDDRRFLGMDP